MKKRDPIPLMPLVGDQTFTEAIVFGENEELPRKVTTLLDNGSQSNIMSSMLAAELGIKSYQNHSIVGANSAFLQHGPVPLYGWSQCPIEVADHHGNWDLATVSFLIVDDPCSPLILGAPWHALVDPYINSVRKTYKFRKKRQNSSISGGEVEPSTDTEVRICSLRTWSTVVDEPDTQVYCCVIKPTSHGTLGKPPDQDDLQEIPMEYYREDQELFDRFFNEVDATTLPEHGPSDLAIDLEEGKMPPWGPLYNLSREELDVVRDYIEKFLKRGWIRRSRSSAGAPILFAKKKDGSLRLCVDYRGLNAITQKNRHPLPLIQESLDRLGSATVYTKIDLRDAYHRLRIKAGDEWKTAFRTRYGLFEYTVVPFGLTNAPAAFQSHINYILSDLIDRYVVLYLDDILIYSNSLEEHIQHVKTVIRRLVNAKLYAKRDKCEFHTSRTEFLGFIVSPGGVSIDETRVKTIQEWPEPLTVHEVRVFVGFANYFRRFIHNFSKLVAPLNALTKKAPGAARKGFALRREEGLRISLTPEARKSFAAIKAAFLKVPILAHFDEAADIRVETDASGDAICGILSQNLPNRQASGKLQWRPVAFYSRKMVPAERNYDTHDQELLAIIESLREWRHYLQGSKNPFQVFTDHDNLRYFMNTKILSRRQARWAEYLSRFHFSIIHRPGKRNPADGPSRRPDYVREAQEGQAEENAQLIKRLTHQLRRKGVVTPSQNVNRADIGSSITAVSMADSTVVHLLDPAMMSSDPRDIPVPAACTITISAVRTRSSSFGQAQETEEGTPLEGLELDTDAGDDIDARDAWSVETDAACETLRARAEAEAEAEAEVQAASGPVLVSNDREKRKILKLAHDDPMAGHFGMARTFEKIQRRYTWQGIRKDVNEYVRCCPVCQRAKYRRSKKKGLLSPLPEPDGPWQWITMDFITDLPPSRLSGKVYDSILVIVDRFSKMVHYLPTTKKIKAVELAELFRHEVIRLHGVPEYITSDRGSVMGSDFWKTFWKHLSSMLTYTTSYHPEGDGQTERQNATLEEYLRCYCNWEQDDWAMWLDIAEFAYNDSVHATTGFTPFEVNYGRHPSSGKWTPTGKGRRQPLAMDYARKTVELYRELKERLVKANEMQKKYADQHRKEEPEFRSGDKVLLANKYFKTLRPKRKLDWRYRGPFEVLHKVGTSAYKLKLPKGSKAYDVFHVSLLEKYHLPKDPTDQEEIRDLLMVDEQDDLSNIYEVDRIDGQELGKDGQWLYKVIYKGYPESDATWEPAINISPAAMNEYLRRKRKADRLSAATTNDISATSRKRPASPDKRGRGRPQKKRRG